MAIGQYGLSRFIRPVTRYRQQVGATSGQVPRRYDLSDAVEAAMNASYANAANRQKIADDRAESERQLALAEKTQAENLAFYKDKLAQEMGLSRDKMSMDERIAFEQMATQKWIQAENAAAEMARTMYQGDVQKWVTGENTKVEREKNAIMQGKYADDAAYQKGLLANQSRQADLAEDTAKYKKYADIAAPWGSAFIGAYYGNKKNPQDSATGYGKTGGEDKSVWYKPWTWRDTTEGDDIIPFQWDSNPTPLYPGETNTVAPENTFDPGEWNYPDTSAVSSSPSYTTTTQMTSQGTPGWTEWVPSTWDTTSGTSGWGSAGIDYTSPSSSQDYSYGYSSPVLDYSNYNVSDSDTSQYWNDDPYQYWNDPYDYGY